jgi:competence protein ComGC
MVHLTNYFLIISLTLLFISACTESVNQTEQSSDEKFLKQIEEAIEALELEEEALVNPKLSIGQRLLSHGSTIEVIETKAKARIEYKSYKNLVNDIKKEAKLRMWSQNKINSKIQYLPRGGYILIHVFSNIIDSANTKWWEYIVLSLNGKEILRKRGSNQIPNFTTSRTSATTWWNTDVVPLTNHNSQPFKVFVIDILSNKRSGIIVYPNMVKK